MTYITLAIFIIAVYHLVWEAAIAPTYRAHLRSRLFKLRDDVRNCKLETYSNQDKEALQLLHYSINFYSIRLSHISIDLRRKLETEYRNDPQLRSKVAKRREILKRAENPIVMEIYAETNNILERAYYINAGGWYIYLVPIALVCLSVMKGTDLVESLLAMPPKNADRLIPEPTASPA